MINLTKNAATRIKGLLNDRGLPETAGMRFGVKGGGCAGFEYQVEVVVSPRKFDMPSRHDTVFVSEGVRLLVDKKSLLFLNGMTIDWEEHNFGHSFVYTNPNATSSCGCGTSFTVND